MPLTIDFRFMKVIMQKGFYLNWLMIILDSWKLAIVSRSLFLSYNIIIPQDQRWFLALALIIILLSAYYYRLWFYSYRFSLDPLSPVIFLLWTYSRPLWILFLPSSLRLISYESCSYLYEILLFSVWRLKKEGSKCNVCIAMVSSLQSIWYLLEWYRSFITFSSGMESKQR